MVKLEDITLKSKLEKEKIQKINNLIGEFFGKAELITESSTTISYSELGETKFNLFVGLNTMVVYDKAFSQELLLQFGKKYEELGGVKNFKIQTDYS